MRNLNESNLTEVVVAGLAGTADPRLRAVLENLIGHLHAFVRETELTLPEWFAGIQFLTATGQKCDDKRQEYILLSDTLGISMLVDAINHRRPGATESTVLGPFYVPGSTDMPLWGDIAEGVAGVPAYVSGRVLDLRDRPIAGATLDVWQTDGDGLYGVQRYAGERPSYARGKFKSGVDGSYGFRTVRPVSYQIPTDGPVGVLLRATGRHPNRPAHVHTMVSAPGYQPVTTHLFVAGDPFLDSDAVFAVKESLIVSFEDHPAGKTPAGTTSNVPFCTAHYDFKLVEQ